MALLTLRTLFHSPCWATVIRVYKNSHDCLLVCQHSNNFLLSFPKYSNFYTRSLADVPNLAVFMRILQRLVSQNYNGGMGRC